jgi:hypothetical protein
MKKILAVLATTALMVAMLAMPASAQPVNTEGLVNVVIVDFADVNIEDVTVQIPVSVAANVCDVNVAALIAEIEDTGTGTVNCDATATSIANGGGTQ